MISDLYKSFKTSVLSPYIPFTQGPQMLTSYQIHLVYTNISEQAVISRVDCGLWALIPLQVWSGRKQVCCCSELTSGFLILLQNALDTSLLVPFNTLKGRKSLLSIISQLKLKHYEHQSGPVSHTQEAQVQWRV